MRVLQINSVVGYGSTGRIAVNLARDLMKDGNDCYVAYGRKKGVVPKDISTIRIGSNLDVIFHVALSRISDKHGFYSAGATRKFVQWINNYNPDVIHLHNLHGYYINLPILFKCLAELNKPVIWTLHDCWAFTGHCAHFDAVGCEKWKTGCCRCVQKKTYPATWLCDNSNENFRLKYTLFTSLPNMTIITPSQWLAELVHESFLKKYPIKVVNNGIDLSVFYNVQGNYRKKFALSGKKIVLGVANVWNDRKGLSCFIKLSKSLSSEYRIVLVGLSKQQRKQLEGSITCIDKIEDVKELAQIYSMADVFVNPTLEDTFPTTNIEALACGTPVVTFTTGGSGEIVSSDSGEVVRKGDIYALQQAIERVCSKQHDYNANCLSCSKKYSKEKQAEEYYRIYREVLHS